MISVIKRIDFLLVFIFFLTIFLFIHFSSPNLFGGDDGYYHISHASDYFKDGLNAYYYLGDVLSFTVFKDNPTDPWFLYHIILSPFSRWGLDGLKIASSIFAAAIFCIFYLLVKWLIYDGNNKKSNWKNLIAPLFWTLFLFLSSFSFVFRLALPRPHLLSVIFFLVLLYLILSKRYFSLSIVLALYVLSYEASVIILIPIFLYFLTEYFFYRKLNIKLLIFSLAGFTGGAILHISTLNFIYSGIYAGFFKVIFGRFFLELRQGGEMFGMGDYNYILSLSLILTLSGIAFIIKTSDSKSLFEPSERNKNFLYLGLLSLFFLETSFFISRSFEYFAPVSVLFIALFASNYGSLVVDKINELDKRSRFYRTFSYFKDRLDKGAFLKYIVFSLTFLILSYVFLSNIFEAIESNKNAPEFDRYKNAAEFLQQNTEKGSIIFNASWDYFPQLYFWNKHNRYLIGADPVFMYEYNKENFWLWENLTKKGTICDSKNCDNKISDPKETKKIIKNIFNSDFIFIDTERDFFKDFDNFLIKNQQDFRLVFQDQKYQKIKIYKLTQD